MPKPMFKRAAALALLFLCLTPLAAPAATITGYHAISRPCRDASGTLRIAIRQYEADSRPHLLLVDPFTLETSVAEPHLLDLAREAPLEAVKATPFFKALLSATSPPAKLHNSGAVRTERPVGGLFLTVDMCPSERNFEQEMFRELKALPGEGGGVPVAIAVSGLWIEKHGSELEWLVKEGEAGRLRITWVNHSYSHPYRRQEALERNFLLTPGIDFEREVLETEKLLLERGLLPSPFFRFPGLVSDERLMEKLRELSLVPIGSDAWLAKGEEAREGSFVLVHGNGNEPKGVARLLTLLKERKGIRLLHLREAFARRPQPPTQATIR